MTLPLDRLFDHLDRMTDERGVLEQATGTVPNAEQGHRTTDNARLLVVTLHEPDTGVVKRLNRTALNLVADAQHKDGRFKNKIDPTGKWTDKPTATDAWGLAMWGFGAACKHNDPRVRFTASRGFTLGLRQRPGTPRAMAYATLGAIEVFADDAESRHARTMLVDMLALFPIVPTDTWMWAESRLTTANAVVVEALIAASSALGRTADLERAINVLTWLVDIESHDGHVSVTGTAGRGPGEPSPQFDQKPADVAALANACWRAHAVTGDKTWSDTVIRCAEWFTGANDAKVAMIDTDSGGAFDSLTATGPSAHQGAEATLAFVSTMQRARSLTAAAQA